MKLILARFLFSFKLNVYVSGIKKTRIVWLGPTGRPSCQRELNNSVDVRGTVVLDRLTNPASRVLINRALVKIHILIQYTFQVKVPSLTSFSGFTFLNTLEFIVSQNKICFFVRQSQVWAENTIKVLKLKWSTKLKMV